MRYVMIAAALAGCSPAADPPANDAQDIATRPSNDTVVTGESTRGGVTPPTGAAGLANDTAPIAETAQDASAQGAAQVVRRYYALIESGAYAQAYTLWAPGRAGMTRAQFVRSFDRHAEYHVEIGAPGAIEGAAGSQYVIVPVRPYGRLREGGGPFNMRGTITLRRVADVPGSTAGQRRWHIDSADIKPRPDEAAPAPAQDNRSTARYRCDGGVRLVARLDPDDGSMVVNHAGQRLATLTQQRAASGIWYRGEGHELRGKGRDMMWTAPGASPLSCQAIMP